MHKPIHGNCAIYFTWCTSSPLSSPNPLKHVPCTFEQGSLSCGTRHPEEPGTRSEDGRVPRASFLAQWKNTHEQYPKHIGNLLDIGNYATQLYIMIRTFKKEPYKPTSVNCQVWKFTICASCQGWSTPVITDGYPSSNHGNPYLGGGNSNMCYFLPYLFSNGWNHQLVIIPSSPCLRVVSMSGLHFAMGKCGYPESYRYWRMLPLWC